MKKILILLIMFYLLLNLISANDKEELSKNNETIKSVVTKLTVNEKTDEGKIKKIFYFVRDEIKFGWVYPQDISEEEVLKNRKGVCMQKTKLLVAMAREAGLKARFHFMYVYKNALEDFIPNYAYKEWMDPFPHTFPEVFINGKWVSMDASFDKELHEICLRENKNFAKYKNIADNVSIDFSENGVKGHQQFWQIKEKESFYGEDLTEFVEYLKDEVPLFKRKMQPLIFKQADKIITELRNK